MLAKAFQAASRKIETEFQKEQQSQPPKGRQSVKKLMNHNAPTNTVPLDGDVRLFDRVARKFNVDYAFYKTEPKKYLLLFKSGQADVITAALSEYTKLIVKRARNRQPPIMEQFQKAAEIAERQRPKHKERAREQELERE